MSRQGGRMPGFTLVDLMVSLAIASFLITGTVQLTLAATGSYRLQQDLAALQENARFALQTIGREAQQAGFRPAPWLDDDSGEAISADSADQAAPGSDRIAFLRWSRRNCYANDNPVTDDSGAPQYGLLESVFLVTASGDLAQTCRYGPDGTSLTTQINRLGLVQNVEALHALYAEDVDGDGNADRWVAAGGWQDEAGIVGVRLAILLASRGQFDRAAGGELEILDTNHPVPDDGRLRRLFTSSFAVKGRSG